MLEDLAAWNVHQARIPLAAIGGYRIDAPMDEDAELRILVPLRHLIGVERFVVGTERSRMAHSVDFLQDLFPVLVILAVPGHPLLVEYGGVRARGGRGSGGLSEGIESGSSTKRESKGVTARKKSGPHIRGNSKRLRKACRDESIWLGMNGCSRFGPIRFVLTPSVEPRLRKL